MWPHPRRCVSAAAPNAIRTAAGLKRSTNLERAVADPFEVAAARIWCQAHTGDLGQNGRNRGGTQRVDDDWHAMASWFRRSVQAPPLSA